MKENKLIDVLKSSNFKTALFSLISLVITGLTNNQVIIDEATISELLSGSILTVIMLLVQIVSKITVSFKELGINWSFLKSSNFWSQFLAVVAIILGVYLNQQLVGFISAGVLLLLNMVFKWGQPVKS